MGVKLELQNMYQIRNDEDEFEPRITPKPASKLDYFAVPSVPEVSLIFDKPLSCKPTEHAGFHSPPVESKGLMYKTNVASPLNVNGSYTAWKEQNYACKPLSSKVNDYITPQRIQSNQNYIPHSHSSQDNTKDILNDSKANTYTAIRDVYNPSQYKGEVHRENDIYPGRCNYEISEMNTMFNKETQSTKSKSNNAVRHAEFVSFVPHAFTSCKNTDNYIVNKSDHSPLTYERKLTTHNSKQRYVPLNESVTEHNVQNLSVNPHNSHRNEFQFPHYLGQQYPYFNMNGYPFSQLHSFPIQNSESTETVKNLLQIINSQNDQIKSLQTQVDRLLKMQEENFKERKGCFCTIQSQHNDPLHVNSNDALTTPSSIPVSETTNPRFYENKALTKESREYYNRKEPENKNQSEPLLTEAQSKQKFMEQKVSIGVMTSFEFTVQNSPFAIDTDNYENKESQQMQENIRMCNTGCSLRDTNDSLRRHKNSFTRMPSAQLENIVEDSESYMSSSQQQSSNLNASTSIKDLEKQAHTENRKETNTHSFESPKLFKDINTKLKETKNCIPKHLERTSIGNTRYETVKAPIIQKNTVNTVYNVSDNRNCRANAIPNMAQRKKEDSLQDNDSVKGTNSASTSDYYKDCKKKRHNNGMNKVNCVEDSLILNGGDLRINERPPPTPEPSIHVEMQEYSSDDDSEKVKRSSKVGWTFYNNVLGQVNQLLQNSCVVDEQQKNQAKTNPSEHDEIENKAVIDTVKVATLEQLKKLGISLNENPEAKELNKSNKVEFDLSFYPRLDYQANMTQATSAVTETNTSMHMKALALKYLTDEQLAELAVQRQGSTSVKHLMVSNVQGTNMSFATMRYLERYQLLPGKNNVQTEGIDKTQDEVSPNADLKITNPKNSPQTLQQFPFSQTPRTTCPSKILDISTLKQQPKLL